MGGGFNMCKAFDDMVRDSKREGKREAEEQMSKLIQILISAGRITDLQQASNNKKYRKKLMVCQFTRGCLRSPDRNGRNPKLETD